jgi:hypothetical protein
MALQFVPMQFLVNLHGKCANSRVGLFGDLALGRFRFQFGYLMIK